MKYVLALFLLGSLLTINVYGQTKLILTTEQNNKWLDSLQHLPFEEQLSALKQRLLSDTNVFVRQDYGDRIILKNEAGNKVFAEAKPLIFVNGIYLSINNNTEANKIRSLAELLSNEYISRIAIMFPNDSATKAIFGTQSIGGAINLQLSKKSYQKKFKRIGLKPSH